MKQISIVIPVFNEEKFIDGLLKSIWTMNYPRENFEVIVVSDGSTDHTTEVVKRYPEVRLIELRDNMGRYYTRKKGAEEASFQNVLFIDSRSVVDPNILIALDQLDAKAVNGNSSSIEATGPFETFYNAIRRVVYYKFYKNYNNPFYLTPENFDLMPKGTTVFYAEKEVLFNAYQDLSQVDMGKDSSDDTKLLRTIVNRVPILFHPDVKITSFARTSFYGSVKHLFLRGPKFVDYYFTPSQNKFWLVIILPLSALLAILFGLAFTPFSVLLKFTILVGLDFLIAIFLARTLREFFHIFFILPLCVSIFYLGIIRGIFLKFAKVLRFNNKPVDDLQQAYSEKNRSDEQNYDENINR